MSDLLKSDTISTQMKCLDRRFFPLVTEIVGLVVNEQWNSVSAGKTGF